jgi:hypothetical protein
MLSQQGMRPVWGPLHEAIVNGPSGDREGTVTQPGHDLSPCCPLSSLGAAGLQALCFSFLICKMGVVSDRLKLSPAGTY